MDVYEIKNIIQNAELTKIVNEVWTRVGDEFLQAQKNIPSEIAMDRKELSFHEHVKLLGYLCCLLGKVEGDIIEIGVWKGKSSAFMSAMCQKKRRIISIDPMILNKQVEELSFYHKKIFPEVELIRGFAELAAANVYRMHPKTVLLHIDGGHAGENVLMDFLIYSKTVVGGGFIVFDDYADYQHSPEVGPAVDLLRAGGYFNGYNVIGTVPGFEASYLIQKR
ncbi:MAG: class I SAM-dependent methyltransferase [Acetobacter peroxydans]|jgi:hypothetical protein|nr:class I SAM-dependent methyltransferase [Acetobacter peroxydans]